MYMEKDVCRGWGVVYFTVLCDHPYLVSVLFAVLVSLHSITFSNVFDYLLKFYKQFCLQTGNACIYIYATKTSRTVRKRDMHVHVHVNITLVPAIVNAQHIGCKPVTMVTHITWLYNLVIETEL